MCPQNNFNHVEMHSKKREKAFYVCAKLGKIVDANLIKSYNMYIKCDAETSFLGIYSRRYSHKYASIHVNDVWWE